MPYHIGDKPTCPWTNCHFYLRIVFLDLFNDRILTIKKGEDYCPEIVADSWPAGTRVYHACDIIKVLPSKNSFICLLFKIRSIRLWF